MKILVIGFSASGKTTFSDKLSKILDIKVMHLDTYHFLDNWVERDNEEFEKIVSEFIEDDNYIVEGNYTNIATKRFEEPDIVFYFSFNRLKCLYGQIRRYLKHRNKVRDEYITDCKERMDFEFIKWILYKGRTKKKKNKYLQIVKNANEKHVFKNRRQVNKYLKEIRESKNRV